MLSMVRILLKYSTPYLMRFFRRNPAVSINLIFSLLCSTTKSIESRVVPGISVTILASFLINLLINEDFPTFGLPTMAIFISSIFSSSTSSSSMLEISKSKKFPMLRPFAAATGNGSPKPNLRKS